MKPGTRVRMTAAYKAKLWADCTPDKHTAVVDGDCYGCSGKHVEEFGDAVGIVRGPVKWGNGREGPEVDVVWQPGNLRYMYHPNALEEA